MDLNENFRNIYKKLSAKNYCYLNGNELDLSIFASFGSKISYDDEDDDGGDDHMVNLEKNSIKLDDFRKLLFLHFIAKFINKKVVVFVTKNESCFIEISKLFNFDDNYLEIRFSSDGENEQIKEILKNSKYAIKKNDYNLVNLKQLMEDQKLQYFDSNISFCNIDFEENLINCAKNLKKFTKNENKKINYLLQICTNSEFVSHQKAFLLSKVLIDNDFINESKYLIVSQVKSDAVSINEYLKLKEKYFQETTAQRMAMPFEICEKNVKLLTICSITFDLLKVSHNSDIKLQTDKFINEHDSAFLLYNCARISAILTKFNHLVSQGIYPPLPDIQEINFETTLKNELEKRLCNEFLLNYENCLNELKLNLIDGINTKKLQIKINIHKLCRFLFDLSKLFSSYYSKVKVLEDPKFTHLYPTMFARIYLVETIYYCLKYLLGLFNIETPERI